MHTLLPYMFRLNFRENFRLKIQRSPVSQWGCWCWTRCLQMERVAGEVWSRESHIYSVFYKAIQGPSLKADLEGVRGHGWRQHPLESQRHSQRKPSLAGETVVAGIRTFLVKPHRPVTPSSFPGGAILESRWWAGLSSQTERQIRSCDPRRTPELRGLLPRGFLTKGRKERARQAVSRCRGCAWS